MRRKGKRCGYCLVTFPCSAALLVVLFRVAVAGKHQGRVASSPRIWLSIARLPLELASVVAAKRVGRFSSVSPSGPLAPSGRRCGRHIAGGTAHRKRRSSGREPPTSGRTSVPATWEPGGRCWRVLGFLLSLRLFLGL